MIDIRTVRSKYKGIRVDIHRRFSRVNDKTQKIEYYTKQVSSFKLNVDGTYPNDINTVLESDEILQLKNWLAEVKFADSFNEEADTLAKFTIRMPQKLYDAYVSLFDEAKQVDIDFIPNQIMLDALLHKAKLVEQKLTKIKGKNFDILERAGVQSGQSMSDEAYRRLLDVESRGLFKALVELEQPISKTCSELEATAKQYGKQKERISAMQLREWAGLAPGRQLKKVNRWVYAIAIEVLLKHGKKPLEIAPPERVIEYWIAHNDQHFTLEEAKKELVKLFNPSSQLKPLLYQVVESHYKTI